MKSKDVGVEARVVLTDNTPVYQPARRLANNEKIEVDKQIDKWYENGVIQPSNLDYSSPIVLVKKKYGDTRVCVNFRKLNEKTVEVRYPQAAIEEQLDQLQDAKVYTTLDLRNGFLHVPVEESSRKFTAFSVQSGHYEFKRMPFGYCNSPAYFAKYIQAVFRELLQKKIVIIYIDDIIIHSRTVEGLQKISLVLNTGSEYGLSFDWKKCQFLKDKVVYLGHVVECGKVSPCDDKTNAVKHFLKPANVKTVHVNWD